MELINIQSVKDYLNKGNKIPLREFKDFWKNLSEKDKKVFGKYPRVIYRTDRGFFVIKRSNVVKPILTKGKSIDQITLTLIYKFDLPIRKIDTGFEILNEVIEGKPNILDGTPAAWLQKIDLAFMLEHKEFEETKDLTENDNGKWIIATCEWNYSDNLLNEVIKLFQHYYQ